MQQREQRAGSLSVGQVTEMVKLTLEKKKKISKNDHLKSKSFCIGTISILPIQSSLRLYLCTVDIRVWKDLRD